MNKIGDAFIAACRDEIEAPKPGNVHVYSDGHGMSVKDFLLSAEAAAPSISTRFAPIGARIFHAIEATRVAVGQNTNLGIVLLCAPLAAAAELGGDLRTRLREVLSGLTLADARSAFAAILRASPAGLGQSARHDVREPAETSLLEAMREAADRDRVAYQYASDFEDIFTTGLSSLTRMRDWKAPWPAVAVYLDFLASFEDSHILRKNGPDAAALVLAEARSVRGAFTEASNPADALPKLLAFDKSLKLRALNPGTSADLTVATLFAGRLAHGLIDPRIGG